MRNDFTDILSFINCCRHLHLDPVICRRKLCEYAARFANRATGYSLSIFNLLGNPEMAAHVLDPETPSIKRAVRVRGQKVVATDAVKAARAKVKAVRATVLQLAFAFDAPVEGWRH